VIRLTQLVGQRVVTAEGGALVGSIRRLLLEPHRGAFGAAEVETPEGRQKILDWRHVTGVTDDALLVRRDTVLRDAEGDRETDLINGRLDILGKTVLTEAGDGLGELEDVGLDEISGRVVRVHLPDQAVTVTRLVALGPDALIIATTNTSSRAASAR
jgi:sporulation protein YlmC with PRC-barrel domain